MEQEFAEGIDSWETMMFLYNSALKEVNTKLEILNDEFVHIHNYNPIEYIKSRIKTPESIVKKLKKGGYKSYHMIVSVPIFLSNKVVDTKVEIQIRTIAMDFWASLEHKIYYKFEGNAPEYISRDLRECAGIVGQLDAKMLSLNEAILEAKEKQEHEREEKIREDEHH